MAWASWCGSSGSTRRAESPATSGSAGRFDATTGVLNHVMAYAGRTLTSDQITQLQVLTAKLETAAGCSSNGSQSPKVLKAATVTAKTVTPTTSSPTTSAPTSRKDTTTKAVKADQKATGGRSSR